MNALARIPDRELVNELRVRTRGCLKEVASDMGISASHLYGIINGNATMGEQSRTRALEMFRLEELQLADRIEAELSRPPLYKEGA
jgi:AraC-like DNA-binding protein